jgi:hypothetical protein
VPTVEGNVLDVRPTGLAHPKAVEPEQHGEGGRIPIKPLGCVEERPELPAVQASALGGMDPRPTDGLGRVGHNPSVDVSEAIDATDRRQPAADGRRCEFPPFYGGSVELDVRSLGLEDS